MKGVSRGMTRSRIFNAETIDAITKYIETFARGPYRILRDGGHVTIEVDDKADEEMIRTMFSGDIYR